MSTRKVQATATTQRKASYQELEQRVEQLQERIDQLEEHNRILEEANQAVEDENAELKQPTNSREIAELQLDLATAYTIIREQGVQLARLRGDSGKSDKVQFSDKPEDIELARLLQTVCSKEQLLRLVTSEWHERVKNMGSGGNTVGLFIATYKDLRSHVKACPGQAALLGWENELQTVEGKANITAKRRQHMTGFLRGLIDMGDDEETQQGPSTFTSRKRRRSASAENCASGPASTSTGTRRSSRNAPPVQYYKDAVEETDSKLQG